MSGVSSAIDALVSAFSSVFSILPSSWSSVIIAGISLFLVYIVLKILLDIIGSFL